MSATPVISLLLPTRERVEPLRRLFDSIGETAERPDGLEVVLFLDSDDTASQSFDYPELSLKRIVGRRATMGRMVQACYETAAGKYIMLMNDDVICRTCGWDVRILEVFDRLADSIGMVWCNDLYRGPAMPNFPILSRRTCEIMGGVCPQDYHRDYVDTNLYDIFRKLERLGHRRWFYLPDVVIEHCHVEAGKAAFDATYHKPRMVGDELAYIAWDENRQIVAETMARAIEDATWSDS